MRLGRTCLSILALAAIGGSATSVALADSKPPAELQGKLDALARRARPGVLGIAVLDLKSGAAWHVNATRDYPMMSVFKAPLAATVLARIDHNEISFDQTITLTRADLRGGRSVIASNFQGDRMAFSIRELLIDAVSQSDSTAADALVSLVGGPQAVTTFLRAHGIEGMHVDLDEGGLARIFENLGSSTQPPANETPEERSRRLQGGYQAFLADPRNRSTPDAAVSFLHKLLRNEFLSRGSTQYLLDLMAAQTVPRRLRNGLPDGVRIADKCGTSDTVNGLTAAFNDIGILTWPDGRTVLVAAFLTASPASRTELDSLFTDLGRYAASFP